MGKTVTIYFKDNKVSRVTGTKSPRTKAGAAAFAQRFADQAVGRPVEEVAEMLAATPPKPNESP